MRPSLLKTWLSQNVWQQSVFGRFLSPLSRVFCGRLLASLRALLHHHPWWFLCKSAKVIIRAIPVCLFPSPLASHHPGYLQGNPVLIGFVLLFFTLFDHLLFEIRTESSPPSTDLEDSNLSFQGHLRSEPMGTYTSMGFGIWWLSSSLCILLRESSETKTVLTDAFHRMGRTVCVTVINAALTRPFSFGLLKQSSCGSMCRTLDRKYMIPS